MGIKPDVLLPKVTKPIRVIFLFEACSSWYEITNKEKEESVVPKLDKILETWKDNGSTLIGTIDADVFSAGRAASSRGWQACFLYDIPTIEIVSEMIHSFRKSELDRYFRLEAIMGRTFKLLED